MEEFIKTTRKFGRNICFVQGAGGNASIKIGKKLYIKASGQRMKNITQKSGIVCLDYEPLRAFVRRNKLYAPEDEQNFLTLTSQNTIEKESFGKPSMEVGFHAIIPSIYVFHLHSIYANSLTCMKYNTGTIKEALPFSDILVLNYFNPGYALALKIGQQQNLPNIIFLKNHGLIVHGNSLEECDVLINTIHAKIIDYLKHKKVYKSFSLLRKIKLFEKYIFPDAAVFSNINITELTDKKKKNILEIMSAQEYITATIQRLKKSPVFLTQKEVKQLLAMDQEKHRMHILKFNKNE